MMEARRTLLRTLLVAGIAAATPTPGQAAAAVLHKQPLPGDFEAMEATFVEVSFEPGQDSAAHRHPGFVLGYVLEGQFRFGVQGEPEKILGPGSVFYEPPGAVHTASGSAGPGTARILAIIIAEKGAPVTLPAA